LVTPEKSQRRRRILLRKDRDLIRPQPLHLHQIVHNRACLFSVAGSIVKNISVWRVAPEQAGAGERAEKQHLAIKSIGQRDCRCGRLPITPKIWFCFFVLPRRGFFMRYSRRRRFEICHRLLTANVTNCSQYFSAACSANTPYSPEADAIMSVRRGYYRRCTIKPLSRIA
jgi:hypothetical protein